MTRQLARLLCLPALLVAATAVAQQAEPGEEWLMTTEMQMQGMSMPPRTSTSCVPRGSTEPPQDPNDKNCESYDVVRTGSTTKWKMRCTSTPPTTGSGEITYQGRDSYQGQMVMTMEGQTMTMKMRGKRTGNECDAGKIKRDVAQAQAQSDRMVAQQCAEAARGMQVIMFDGSYPIACEAKYKQEFCNRMSTEEGFDLLAVNTGRTPTTNLPMLESAGKTCGKDPQVVHDKLCGDAQKRGSLLFMARHCPEEAAPLAQAECAGRTFTNRPAEKYQEFCNTYAQHALRGEAESGNAAAGASGSAGAQQGSTPPPEEGAVEKSKKALKKLLPF